LKALFITYRKNAQVALGYQTSGRRKQALLFLGTQFLGCGYSQFFCQEGYIDSTRG